METVLIAFIALFALLLLGVPLGFGMGVVGTIGFAYVAGWDPALNMVGITSINAAMSYSFSVLPLFMLMGSLFAHSKMAEELYSASYAMIGHRRGGLAMATILACGGFSAVSGSAMACAATMTRISVPLMRSYGYSPGFAAGTVAAGATLDILIPPSTPMVIYALLTETDLGRLMIAGFLPGLLTVACYLAVIATVAHIWPQLGPAGQKSTWAERFAAIRQVWALVALFGVVLGGIYFGVFTPTEAAGIGALGALILAVLRRRLTWPKLAAILVETVHATASLLAVLVGALIFANFVTVTGATADLEQWVGSMNLSATALILAILVIYIVLGCVLEGTAMMLLTIPIFFPIVVAAGIDPIWFGIFVVIMAGVGSIHPPMGILLFVVRALVPDLRTNTIFAGVAPYLAGDLVRIALLIAFPSIVLLLPSLMK